MATAPTSGSYSGIYLYQTTALPDLATVFIDGAISELEAIGGEGNVVRQLKDLTLGTLVDGDTTATFGSKEVTVGGTSYDDADVVATSATAFEFKTGAGDHYVLANGKLGLTVDKFIDKLIGEVPDAKPALVTIKAQLDELGYGKVLVIDKHFGGAPYVPPCFVRGTLIATARGDVAVEDLREGDLVTLAAGGTAPVKWIGHRRVDLRLQGFNPTMRPVLVRAGALGDGVPRRDLRVSADHALFLDGVLVPAGLLINDAGIVSAPMDVVEYFHVELPAHAVLLAEGAPAESYLDTGNRGTFSNAALVSLVPDFTVDAAAVADAGPVAEMVLGGPVLERIRAALGSVTLPAATGTRRLAV